MQNRDIKLMKSALVVNIDVKDNHEGAAAGARLALEFCRQVSLIMSKIKSILHFIFGHYIFYFIFVLA